MNKTKNTKAKQAIGLFTANIISIPIGIITSIIITKYLGANLFGNFQLIQSIFNISITIFTFGLLQAGNRALVKNFDKKIASEYYGAELIICSVIFIIMSTSICLYAVFDENINEKNLSETLVIISPLCIIYLLTQYFETLLQADNKINLLIKIRIYPKFIFLASTIIIYYYFIKNDFDKIILVYIFSTLSQAVVYIPSLLKLEISFKNIKSRIDEILMQNKSFGWDVYVGSLFAVGFSQLTNLIISYYSTDNKGVGFYSLALVFTAPLAVIPNTIATTHYKDFANSSCISKKLITITASLSISSLILLWLALPLFIRKFYGEDFEDVIKISLIISIGMLAHGISDFFNRFLGANGQGKALRNSSFVVGGSIAALNMALIPWLAEVGAAYARLINGFIYLLVIYYYYHNYTKHKTT